MKKVSMSIILGWLLLSQGQMFSWIYLWEMNEDSNRSCCLHYCGVDICNPYKPCTHFAKIDLTGIFDYVTRLMGTDHAKIEPHQTLLAQVKAYIRSVLYNPHKSLYYKVPECTAVKFYHDIIEADFLKSKDKKESTPKAKCIKDDPVAIQLLRMGLLQKR